MKAAVWEYGHDCVSIKLCKSETQVVMITVILQ